MLLAAVTTVYHTAHITFTDYRKWQPYAADCDS